ncbi:NAD-P-binding protein [Pholiota conissans]|uniref:NAD-P-binding protein n=1 Tax=Pholiota conissans TaxID=109636 RepID=A0A9P6CRA9_9AGAR|nr:NAD-P-binding protein [Pholiota conissans]
MSLTPNKVVCITGASRGIGRACALEFTKQCASGLILHYLGDAETEREVQSLKAEVQRLGTSAIVVPGDIADFETSEKIVAAGVEAFGRIDVLVSNVGICPFSDFLDMPLETWDRTRQVNLDGTFYIVQAAAQQMAKQTPQGGSLIAISSISGLLGGAQQCHYGPTKAAITNLMQNCAVALGKYGIRANAVLPGTVATDINKEDLKNEAKREYMVNRTLLGRLGTPEDIAGPVVFLASDLARYMTGSSIIVDGGSFVNFQ